MMFAGKTAVAAFAAALWTIGPTAPAAQAQLSTDRVATAPVSLSVIADSHEQLWIRLNDLWDAIKKSRGAAEDRTNFVRFIRAEVLEQLHREGVTIYIAFDSLSGGGYATIAALYDREVIDRLANQLDAQVSSESFAIFGERSFALAVAVQNYIRKTDELVLPVVQAKLSATSVETLLARLKH
jgi:hypothetical protein